MRKPRNLPLVTLALVGLAWVPSGCGKSSTAPPGAVTQQTADDIAIQAATNLQVVGGDVGAAIGSFSSAPAPLAGARPARAEWDTSFTRAGMTYEASRIFYDAFDEPLPEYGPTAVRMLWTSRAYGTFEGPRDTATVGHAGSLEVRGLEAEQDTLRFNGGCLDTLLNRFRSLDGFRMRYFYWTSALTIADVRLLKSMLDAGGQPVSGTATLEVSCDRLRSNDRVDAEAHFVAVVVVTFDGTDQPEITVNGTYRYRWNMTTGQLVRA